MKDHASIHPGSRKKYYDVSGKKNVNYNNYMNFFQGVVHLSGHFINILNPITIFASQIPHCGKKSTANPIRTLP